MGGRHIFRASVRLALVAVAIAAPSAAGSTDAHGAVTRPAPRSSSVHAGVAGAGAIGNHWPVPGVPTVRSDFYDLRWSSHDRRWGLHGGLDIAVDEREWSSGAPVRAIEGGDVWSIVTFRGCSAIRVGRFGYGHVLPRPGLEVG
jgi:murein DD-endopeptidase MepM/ murein hydrolase activator NlpD